MDTIYVYKRLKLELPRNSSKSQSFSNLFCSWKLRKLVLLAKVWKEKLIESSS